METLAVVIIMAILGAMAMPAINRSTMQTKVDRAAYSIANDVQAAFSLAAREGKPVTYTVNSTALRFVVADRATGTVMHDRYFGVRQSPFGLTSIGMSAPSITVFPNGTASGSVEINLTLRSYSRTVRVSRVGFTRVS
jgi:type II secretory pathway pseudopilin PulG